MPFFRSVFSILGLLCGLMGSANAFTAEPMIIHGKPATATQAPWQVALFMTNAQNQTGYICSGTLIDAQWVLTAAHCVSDSNSGIGRIVYYAVAGITDLDDIDNARVARVGQITVHPDYQASLNLDNDIALLKLEQPLNLSACGARCQVIPWLGANQTALAGVNASAQIAGWGRLQSQKDDSIGEPYSPLLQVAPFKIISCTFSSYQFGDKAWPVSRNMFCATGATTPLVADTCEGDSGSGLVVNIAASQPLLAGITSFGEKTNCGERKLPSFYTRVSNYDDWILSYVNPAAYAERIRVREQPATQQQNHSSGGGGSASLGVILGLLLLAGLRLNMLKN